MVIAYGLYIVGFVLPALACALYYWFLMTVRLAGGRAYAPEGSDAAHTFAIVIPAHNEEGVIARALRSCAELDYPPEKYQVFVVADNCDDRTSEIARESRITCLERSDAQQRGKGYALEWAFERILPMHHDAIVVLDADCVIDAHALRVFDHCLQQGDKALQANYVLSNPDASPISYMARVGNVLEYEFFYAPKSALHLAVMLVGTGMVFHRDVLLECPWRAHSLVEDAEYTLMLARRNLRVRFLANVRVVQAGAEDLHQLRVQRSRWTGGTIQLGKRSVAPLILECLATGRLLLADAGWTLLVVTRPLIILHLVLTLAFGVLLGSLEMGTVSQAVLVIVAGIVASYIVYLSIGVAAVGLSGRRICYLFVGPAVLALMAVIAIRASVMRRTAWVRTPR